MATKVNNIETEDKVDVNETLLKRLEELESKLSKQDKEVGKASKNIERSPLMNKKVILEPINKGVSSVIPGDAAQATMLKGTNRSIILPIDKLGRLADPLEKWERDFLEKTTGLNLDIYSEDCFYKTRKAVIKFKRRGQNLDSASIALDLNDPYQYILYKIALKSPEVANKWEDRKNPLYSYVIRDNDAQLAEDIAYNDKDDAVLEYLLSIKTNKKALFDLLRLYGNNDKLPVRITSDKPVEWLYNELRKISKTVKGIRNLYNIITIIENSPNRMASMVLVEDAVICGALVKLGKKYSKPGGDIIGNDITEACQYLENPENQEDRLYISNKVDKYLKDK